MWIWPDVGCKTPQMHLSNVDLPDPLWPTSPTVSFVSTEKLMSFRALNVSVDPLRGWSIRSFSD